jgi:TolA-binding protein
MAALKSMTWLRRGLRIAPLCLLGLTSLTGCVATKKDMRTLQQQLAQMNASNQANQDAVRQATARELRILQDSIRASTELMRTMRGQLTNDISQLRNLLGELQQLLAQNEQRITQLREMLDRVETAASRQQQQQQNSGGQSGGQTADSLYMMGQEKLSGSPATAQLIFQDIVNSFPQHRLAPDAQFFVGEALVAQERWDEAFEAFEAVANRFPTATRAPSALLRAGEVAADRSKSGSQSERTRMRNKAREYYNRVIKDFASSGEATVARRSLANLR